MTLTWCDFQVCAHVAAPAGVAEPCVAAAATTPPAPASVSIAATGVRHLGIAVSVCVAITSPAPATEAAPPRRPTKAPAKAAAAAVAAAATVAAAAPSPARSAVAWRLGFRDEQRHTLGKQHGEGKSTSTGLGRTNDTKSCRRPGRRQHLGGSLPRRGAPGRACC